MNIDEFQWDDGNVEHIRRRGLVEDQLESVIDGRYLLLRNKRDASGDYRLIGRDKGGRLLTIVIVATDEPAVWRPVTGVVQQ